MVRVYWGSKRIAALGEEKPVPPYSAIVYKEGDEVRAEDWKGRKIASGEAGVDDASVIQGAIDNLPSGGICFLRAGIYNISSTITINKDSIWLKGEGPHTYYGKEFGTTLRSAGANPILEIPSVSLRTHEVTISDVELDGNDLNINILKATDADNLRLERVVVRNAHGYGIYLENVWVKSQLLNVIVAETDSGIYMEGCSHVTLINAGASARDNGYALKLTNSGGIRIIDFHTEGIGANAYGIYISGGSHIFITQSEIRPGENSYGIYASDSKKILITSSIIFNVAQGIELNGVKYHNICGNVISSVKNDGIKITGTYGGCIIGNVIYGCDGSGIHLENIWVEVVSNNRVTDNAGKGLTIIGGSDHRILCNIFSGNTADVDIDNITKHAYINNRPELTKSAGTATFSGDGTTTQFSIAHGLVSTPTKIQVTPMTADAASDFYVTADDTNIYVNYKSAPPSGTDNLKFSWYAEV